MVVVAHPDDEVLGLGASMHRLIHNADIQTHVVILGEGLTSRSDNRDVSEWEKRLEMHRADIQQSIKAVGYHSVSTNDFPDNRFDTVALLDLIKVVEKEKGAFRPDVIFTHHGGDLNIDHRRTFEAVMTASRPLKEEHVKAIISFETPSGTEWRASADPVHFIPNLFIDVSADDLSAKITAMESYRFEKRPWPHPRSPEGLTARARFWGMTSGSDYAEAFQMVRARV